MEWEKDSVMWNWVRVTIWPSFAAPTPTIRCQFSSSIIPPPLLLYYFPTPPTVILLPVLQFYSPTSLYSSTVLHLSTVLQFSTTTPRHHHEYLQLPHRRDLLQHQHRPYSFTLPYSPYLPPLLLRPNYPPIVILLISQSVKKEPVTTASAASPSTLTAHYAVKSTNTTPPASPTYFPFVYVHPTPTTYHLPPRRDLYNYLVLHTSLLCPVPLHTPYLTCSSTTTTWTTTSDEQHVKPQNHTVIVSKLQRSIVTFSSTEDRKRKEKSSVIEPIPWVKTSYVIQSIRL